MGCPMPSHKFQVGETVYVRRAISRNVPSGAYVVTKQLPHNGREFEYRIKSASEEHGGMVDGGRPAVFITRQAPVSSCRRRGPIEGGGSGVARSGSHLPGTKRRHVTPLMARTEPSPVSMKMTPESWPTGRAPRHTA